MRLDDEKIAAIRDGTDGVTPGAWCLSKTSRWPRVIAILPERVDVAATTNDYDASHIARCDPDTIRALATEVLESRAEIARLTKERDEARALQRPSVSSLDEDQSEDAIVNESRSIARLCLDVDRLTDIITDSIDLDWTPRDAAKAIVRAMGGDAT